MKTNNILLIIYLYVFLSLLTFSATKPVNLEIPGLIIKNMKIEFISISEIKRPIFYISTNFTQKSQIDIINAGEMHFFSNISEVWIYNVNKLLQNSRIPKTKKILYFKQENTIDVLLSEDKITWEKLEMKVISLNPPPQVNFTKTKVFCALYLKCTWFEGEYYLMDSPELYEEPCGE